MEQVAMTRKVRAAVFGTAGLCLAAASVLSLAGCGLKLSASPQGAGKEAPGSAVRVGTMRVGREDLERVSDATPAELLPYEQTDLYAKVSGYVQEMRVDYGDRVKKGDVLAVLWVPEMEVELKQNEALVQQALAEVQLARDAVGVAVAECRWRKAQFERLKGVEESSGALARESVKEIEYAFEASAAKRTMAQSDVTVKAARLEVAKENREQVKTLLRYARIEAPYDGVVTRRNLHTGAFINSRGGEQPLLTVVRTDKLRVVTHVPEKDVRFLHKDDPIQAQLNALPGKKFTWTISRLAPALGDGKMVRVEAEVQNGDGTLYPGMYGYASVILEKRPGALTVPSACLGSDDKGAFVWLAADGQAKRQRVTVGLNDGKKAEITSGLAGTEQVISSGKEGLRDGQPVAAQDIGAGASR
jgi:RND family efflux transporter MFP subunit